MENCNRINEGVMSKIIAESGLPYPYNLRMNETVVKIYRAAEQLGLKATAGYSHKNDYCVFVKTVAGGMPQPFSLFTV